MSKIKTKQFFDEYVQRENKEDVDFDKILFTKDLDSMKRVLANLTGNILDIGCGDGVYSRAIANWKHDVFMVGIDISLESVKRAEFNRLDNVTYVACDVERLPFGEGVFDTVIAVNALHHFGYPMLTAATEVLRRNGIIYISDHVVENPLVFVLRKIFSRLPTKLKIMRSDASGEGYVAPIFLYSVPWLNDALATFGFNEIYLEHFEIFATILAGLFNSFVKRNSSLQKKLLKAWWILNASEERLLVRIPMLRRIGYRIRVEAELVAKRI